MTKNASIERRVSSGDDLNSFFAESNSDFADSAAASGFIPAQLALFTVLPLKELELPMAPFGAAALAPFYSAISKCNAVFDFKDEPPPVGYSLNSPGNDGACRFFDRKLRLRTICDTRPLMCRVFNCDLPDNPLFEDE